LDWNQIRQRRVEVFCRRHAVSRDQEGGTLGVWKIKKLLAWGLVRESRVEWRAEAYRPGSLLGGHPSQHPRGIAGYYGVVGHVARHHAARPDDDSFTDGDAAEDGGAGANRRPAFYPRRDHLPVGLRLQRAVGGGVGVLVVDERYVVTDEHVVFNGDALANERVARHFHVVTNAGVFLDLDEGPDLGVVADGEA